MPPGGDDYWWHAGCNKCVFKETECVYTILKLANEYQTQNMSNVNVCKSKQCPHEVIYTYRIANTSDIMISHDLRKFIKNTLYAM